MITGFARLLAMLAMLLLAPQPAAAHHQTDIWGGPACVTRVVDGDTVAIDGLDHTVRQRDYARTQANVQCFDTEGQAQAAGYRRALR